jgi:hypothetical protein
MIKQYNPDEEVKMKMKRPSWPWVTQIYFPIMGVFEGYNTEILNKTLKLITIGDDLLQVVGRMVEFRLYETVVF